QMVRRDRNHPCVLAYEVVLNETYHVPYGYTKKSALVALEEQKSAKIATESYGYDHREEANGIDQEADFIFGFQQPLEKTKKAVMFLREYADTWLEAYGDFTSRRVVRGITDGFYPGGEARNVIKANKMLWDTCDENHSLADGYAYRDENKAFVACALWTGIDSRGAWSAMSPCGVWDGFRLPKFSYYAFESQRPVQKVDTLEELGVETGPMVFIASHWTAKCPVMHKVKESDAIQKIGTDELREIFVYSNADEVTLSVEKDSTILWEQTMLPLDETRGNQYVSYLPHPPFKFENVPYVVGSNLKALAYNKQGEIMATHVVKTAFEPHRIQLEVASHGVPIVADGSDMTLVYATVLDKEGNICTEAANSIYFTLSGEASIVGDGDRLAQTNPFKAEAGIAAVYVKASTVVGKVKLTASSYGLECGEVEINIEQPTIEQASYIQIKQRSSLDSASMNLSDQEVLGELKQEQVLMIDGEYYPNSILLAKDKVSDGRLVYNLQGRYTQLKASCYIVEGNQTAELQVWMDGILRYQANPQAIRQLELNTSQVNELELRIKTGEYAQIAILSAYFLQEESVVDESELHENIASNKSATASVNPQNAQKVIEGKGTWMGSRLINEEPQWWQVDLGECYNIRNMQVHIGGQMGSDCTHYTYQIHTSLDGEHWVQQVENKRTSWSNGILDKFVATDVRYIRVTFTHIDGIMSAAIGKFEAYYDYGVDSVKEYDLKGITIEDQDLLFDPKTTQYAIQTNEKELRIRAIPMDRNATVEINDKEVGYPLDGKISSVVPMVINLQEEIAEKNETRKIKISVVSESGMGRKDYYIQVIKDNK
ncbi:MAG: discoidin domain-containing protein, partial [Cellulosilyticaceae bacterium]